MKVLHLLSSNIFSGAENVACQIIKMTSDDVEAVYCCPNGNVENSLADRGISFLPLKKLSISEIRRVIKEYKPDIIHAHDPRAICMAALSTRKVQIIGHVHSNKPEFHSKTIVCLAFAWLIKHKNVKKIFWVSQASFDDFIFNKNKKIASKSQVLFNVIDCDEIIRKSNEKIEHEKFDISYLGRLVDAKNPERLVEICKLLKEHKPNIKMAVIGAGELLSKCEEITKEYGLESNIKFFGFMNNAFPILKDSKLFLMTSRYEGTPMCILEAQTLGLPIIVPDIVDMRAVVLHGETGYFYQTNEEAKNYILDLLNNEEHRKEIAQNVQKFAVEYNDKNKYTKEILNAYKE